MYLIRLLYKMPAGGTKKGECGPGLKTCWARAHCHHGKGPLWLLHKTHCESTLRIVKAPYALLKHPLPQKTKKGRLWPPLDSKKTTAKK